MQLGVILQHAAEFSFPFFHRRSRNAANTGVAGLEGVATLEYTRPISDADSIYCENTGSKIKREVEWSREHMRPRVRGLSQGQQQLRPSSDLYFGKGGFRVGRNKSGRWRKRAL